MPGTNALALAAGGFVVIALSFGAGMLGGSVASPGAELSTAPAPRSVPDSVVRGRIDELDRRLGNVEERLRIVEDTADQALTRTHEIDALRRALDALRNGEAGPIAPAPPVETDSAATDSGPPPAEPLTDEQRAEREAAQIEKLRAQAKLLAEKHAEPLLTQQLSRIADATAQGAADRNSQLYAEAKMLAREYAMTADEEDRVREILNAANESAVREVAPYLGGGLERADHATLKSKLFAVWDARDARMADVLDENELENYRETQKGWREAYAKVLDAWDSARLGNE